MRSRVCAPTLAALVAAVLPAQAGAQSVRSGPLTATLDAATGRVSFGQAGAAAPRDGRLVLRTATGDVPLTGVTPVRAAGRAREALLSAAGLAVPRLRVRLEPRRRGVIALRAAVAGDASDVTAVAIEFDRAEGERHYGFGERSDAVDQRGRTVESYVSDGPFPGSSAAIASAILPPQGFRDRSDATYYPVPWLLSGRGYGVLVDDDETSTFALGSRRPGRWSVEVAAPRLGLRVFAGPTPARALARFTRATGRQPPPEAPWAFGPWLQTGQPNAPPLSEQRADLAKLRAADAPVSAAETQLRYLPCGLDRGYEDYEAERTAYYHRQGLAVLTYVNPMACASYDAVFGPAAAAGGLQRSPQGGPAVFGSFVGGVGGAGFSVQPVAQFDFTAAAGRRAYAEVIERIVATGHDGWMEDFGEYTPLDAVSADGTPGAAMHNRYPATYHCAVRDIVGRRPLVRFQRSGWTGAARCASLVWGGDPTTTWGFDGLASAVKQALSMGLSGVSRWGSDIGGYDTLGDDPRLTPELLKRWIQLGAVSGVMRIKKSGLAIPAYERPQVWDPGVIGVWRRYAKLHTQLYPYIAAADARYRRTGVPLMRALVLEHPGDRRAAAVEDAFGFGPDLLAAPVVRPGARSRRVYLPAGRWIDGAGALRYARRSGGFHAGPARALAGRRTVRVAAPLERLPLFVRAGAVLPMLPADVSTLSDHGRGRAVRLRDRAGRLRLLAFPVRGTRRARMYGGGERLVSTGGRGGWTLRIAGARTRSYRVEASLGLLGLRPCAVTAGGRALRWRWDGSTGVLVARLRARSATLRVAGC